MPISSTDLQTKINKLVTNMDRLDSIVNSANPTTVVVDSGNVPSYATLAGTLLPLAGLIGCATKAELLALTSGYPVKTGAYVFADGTSAFNGIYQNQGNNVTSNWVRISALSVVSGLPTGSPHGVVISTSTTAPNIVVPGDGQVLIGQTAGSDPLAKTINGDAALADTGALTVSKTGGVSFNNADIWTATDPSIIAFEIDANGGVIRGLDRVTGLPIGVENTVQRLPISATWNGSIVYGQSLSEGYLSVPALSTSQPYSNLTFGSGPRSSKSGDVGAASSQSPGVSSYISLVENNSIAADGNSAITTTGTATSSSTTVTVASATGLFPYMLVTAAYVPANTIVVSVVGNVVTLSNPTSASASAQSITFSACGETPCSGLANYCTEYLSTNYGVNPANFIVFASCAGRGGTSIEQLSKLTFGYPGFTWYQVLLDQAQGMATLAAANGVSLSIQTVSYVQGEANTYTPATTTATSTAGSTNITLASAVGVPASGAAILFDAVTKEHLNYGTNLVGTTLTMSEPAFISESNHVITIGFDQNQYQAALQQLASDLSADIVAITGQASPVHMLLYQTATNITTAPQVALAQWQASRSHPLVHFVTPIFFLDTVENLHLTNLSELILGARLGRAKAQLVSIPGVKKGKVPDSIDIVSAYARGTSLVVNFRVPTAPLVLDTVHLQPTTDKGIVVKDDSGTLTLSSIAVGSNGTSLTMTLNRSLSTNPVFRLGLDNLAGGYTHYHGGGASHNVADSTLDTFTHAGTSYWLGHVAPALQFPISVLAAGI